MNYASTNEANHHDDDFPAMTGDEVADMVCKPVASAPASVGDKDVDALKSSWRNDPCFDIEDTPGFEAYHDELLEYRLSIEKQSEQRLIDRAKAVDCSVETMRLIEMLESRIRTLENKLDATK